MQTDITKLLEAWSDGDTAAGKTVMDALYPELRAIAHREWQREMPGHTLQPTAVAHEAFIRLSANGGVEASSRAHFLAIAAKVMRRLLVDHARSRSRKKRGGDLARVELADELQQTAGLTVDILDLDRSLTELSELDEMAAEVVELKFIGGLTIEEIAASLQSSRTVVVRKWRFARAWLRGRL